MGTKSTLNTKKAIHCLLRSRWSLAAGRDKGEDYREWRLGHAQGGVCQGSEVRLSIVFFVFLFFFKPSSAALSWWNRDSTGLRLLGQGRQGHWLTRASDTFTLSETERRTITHPSTPTRTYVDICSSGGMVQAFVEINWYLGHLTSEVIPNGIHRSGWDKIKPQTITTTTVCRYL